MFFTRTDWQRALQGVDVALATQIKSEALELVNRLPQQVFPRHLTAVAERLRRFRSLLGRARVQSHDQPLWPDDTMSDAALVLWITSLARVLSTSNT